MPSALPRPRPLSLAGAWNVMREALWELCVQVSAPDDRERFAPGTGSGAVHHPPLPDHAGDAPPPLARRKPAKDRLHGRATGMRTSAASWPESLQ